LLSGLFAMVTVLWSPGAIAPTLAFAILAVILTAFTIPTYFEDKRDSNPCQHCHGTGRNPIR
jgi:hypothetical protein